MGDKKIMDEEERKNKEIINHFYEDLDQESLDKYGTFTQYSSLGEEESETLKIILPKPKNYLCKKCGEKIDLLLYMARKKEQQNNLCLKCTKKQIKNTIKIKKFKEILEYAEELRKKAIKNNHQESVKKFDIFIPVMKILILKVENDNKNYQSS